MKKPPKLFVRPRKGFLVRKPRAQGSALMKPDGEKVPDTIYWRRRIVAGDVVLIEQQKAKKTSPKKGGTK